MAKYVVDKKLFDQRLLEEQLRQVDLQSKYLKDEPLMRSEVDEYNKLRSSGWVKNTLITLGVLSATAIAFVVFILLGNMLLTNGRTGDVGKFSLNSSDVYTEFVNDDTIYPTPSLEVNHTETVDYKVPSKFLLDPTHDVYITYRLEWRQYYDSVTNLPISGSGIWIVQKTDETIGYLTPSTSIGLDSGKYELDSSPITLNSLMTNWFKGQEAGWAKTLIEDFFYTAWPLTLVLWLVFILAISGYAIVLVVGIRYVIRTIILALRKAGYIASDFVSEVVGAIKSEIPIIETEKIEELTFTEMTKKLADKMEEDRANFNSQSETVVEPEVKVEKPAEKPAPVETKKSTGEKTPQDKIKDIFGDEVRK